MAFDTVIDKTQFEAGLTATANAIRKKTGDSALIEWTTDKGFADAVDAIKNSDISTLQGIIFYDCYGEAIDTYSVDQIDTLTALPDLPEVDGLICEGWNYSLNEIKAHGRDLCVGANYTTNDGKTRIYITLTEGNTCPMLGVAVNGTVTVNWGDDSTPDILTGGNLDTIQWTPNHQYASVGEYIITLTVDGTMVICGDDFLIGSCLLRNSRNIDITNQNYQNSIQKIELGNNVVGLSDYALSNCGNLTNISIPNCVLNIGAYAFHGCASLKTIIIPDGVLHINDSTFEDCYSLTSVSIPNSVTTIGEFAFSDCYSLASITIPDSVIGIGEDAFNNCARLVGALLPNGELILGTVDFEAYCYNDIGELIATIYPEGNIPEGAFNSNAPLFSSSNMKAGDASTVYIAVKNTGTLDMEYKIVFYVNSPKPEDNVYLGACWYKLTEITTELNEVMLEDYAVSNPSIPCNSDNCAEVHICTEKDTETKSMVHLPGYYFGKTLQKIGTTCYYRLDYGMYRDATLDEYSDRQFSVSAGIYAAQDGALKGLDGGVEATRMVTDQETLQAAIDQALPGDTIFLLEDITYTGDLIIKKCINFEAGNKTLTVAGNMIYDFVSSQPLTIDLRGKGSIKVLANGEAGGNFTISAPKSQVEFIGSGESDLFIDGLFTIDTTNTAESNGCMLSSIVITDGEGFNPKTIYVRSNTKISVGDDVVLECVEATVSSTNIEIKNEGQINQIILKDTYLTNQVNAPQIYIHNYNKIGNIVLPSWAAPFIKDANGGYNGNTRITNSFNSVIDTLTGSANFNSSNIEDEGADLYVEQIESGSNSALRVYYRNLPEQTNTTLQKLLEYYFSQNGITSYSNALKQITKLEIVCRGDKVITATDFTYIKTYMTMIEDLDLFQAALESNSLPAEAFRDVSSLKSLILPRSVTTIGTYALSGTSIKSIIIPATVTRINSNALNGISYVYMQSYEPCTFSSSGHGKTYFFVPESSLTLYKTTGNWISCETRIYLNAVLADDGETQVRKLGDGTYEIVHYLGVLTELKVGENVTLGGTSITVTSVGENAYRHITYGFTLKFAPTVTNIAPNAFYSSGVRGIIDFGGVKTIGNDAFRACTGITAILDGNYIESIGAYAFEACSSLYQVVLSNIKSVSEGAFSNTQALVSITFGDKVENIAKYQFMTCGQLREISIRNHDADSVTIATAIFSSVDASVMKTLKVYVPSGSYQDYYTKFMSSSLSTRVYVLCEDGEVYGSNVVEVRKDNNIIGTVDLGLFRVYDYGDGTVSISSCTLTSKDSKDASFWSSFDPIPEAIEGKTVVRLGAGSYRTVPFSNITATKGNTWGNNNASIPNSIKEIGAYAFYNSDVSVTSLSSVETVGTFAFYGATKLYYVDGPSLVDLGASAFSNCKGLRQFRANNVTAIGISCFDNCSNLLRLYVSSFEDSVVDTPWLTGTNNLVELWISINGTTSLKNRPSYDSHPDAIIITYADSSGAYKQYNVSNVMPANIKDYYITDDNGNTLCVLEDMADYWVIEETADELDNTVTIVNYFQREVIVGTFAVPTTLQAIKNGTSVSVTVVSIGKAAFVGADFGGNAVSFGPTVKKLYTNVFRLNNTLGGNINLNAVEELGQYSFYNTGITGVVAPKVHTISTYVFEGCSLLKTASMPELTVVRTSTFANCTSLESVYFEKVTAFQNGAFYAALKLTSITINRVLVDATELPTFSFTASSYGTDVYTYKFEFYVNSQSVQYYRDNANYSKFPIHTLDTVMSTTDGNYSLIGNGDGWELISFTPLTSITSLTVPQTYDGKDILYIRAGAFSLCSAVTSITLPASYCHYQYGAFAGMNELKEVLVATGSDYYKSVDGVLFTENGDELVYYPVRKAVTSYTVPADTKIIQSYAFEGVTALQSLTISANVSVIGYKAFEESGINTFTFLGTSPAYLVDTDVFNTNIDGFAIYVPAGSGDIYKVASGFIKYADYIHES